MLRYNFCTNIFAIPKPMEWLRRFRDQTSLFCKGNRRTQGTHALLSTSDVDLLCDCQGIINFNTKIPNSAFDLFVTKKQLYCSQIACASIDQRRLSSAKRMSTKGVGI